MSRQVLLQGTYDGICLVRALKSRLLRASYRYSILRRSVQPTGGKTNHSPSLVVSVHSTDFVHGSARNSETRASMIFASWVGDSKIAWMIDGWLSSELSARISRSTSARAGDGVGDAMFRFRFSVAIARKSQAVERMRVDNGEGTPVNEAGKWAKH